MTKPKAKQPLSSFDPRMLQLLIYGARKRIVIPFLGESGKKLAHSFHRRLHTLRARMRSENHEHSELSSKAYIRILWGSKAFKERLNIATEWRDDDAGHLGAFIVIQPRDSEFDSILSSLHLSAPEDSEPLTALPSSKEEADLTAFLASLPNEGEK